MGLVVIFTSMAVLSFCIAFGSAIAERSGRNVDELPANATVTAVGFIGLALVSLLFI